MRAAPQKSFRAFEALPHADEPGDCHLTLVLVAIVAWAPESLHPGNVRRRLPFRCGAKTTGRGDCGAPLCEYSRRGFSSTDERD
jgi:hypothetical protein